MTTMVGGVKAVYPSVRPSVRLMYCGLSNVVVVIAARKYTEEHFCDHDATQIREIRSVFRHRANINLVGMMCIRNDFKLLEILGFYEIYR